MSICLILIFLLCPHLSSEDLHLKENTFDFSSKTRNNFAVQYSIGHNLAVVQWLHCTTAELDTVHSLYTKDEALH